MKKGSYLSSLTFPKGSENGLIARYITNIRIVLLLIITVVFLGVVSYTQLPRRLNPEVEIPIVNVVTVLPGASPDDMESLVTIPLEQKLKSVEGLSKISSTSQDNVSVTTLEFASSVSRDDAKDRTQSAVDTVTNLPEDAIAPSVMALDFENQPIWTFAIISKDNDVPSLMRFSDALKHKLEDVTSLQEVTVRGFEEQEIVVEINEQKVAQYGINPIVLSQAIKAAVASYPAGTVVSSNNTFSLTIVPEIDSISTVRALPISVAGRVIKLGDIAAVSERSKPNIGEAYYIKDDINTRAVTIDVYKLLTAKIDSASKDAHAVVEEAVKASDGHFEIVTITNSAADIKKQFDDLVGEFRTTILLVFACLFIFLGLRQAIIASLTVPLTFLSAFIFMNAVGMSINFLSMFAFLLALGLLVDDTIVVVSAMTTYFKTGKFTPKETGILVWRDTIVPIWSTTITTIWSFVPLLLSTGIIGEFIKPIPVVVTAVMISSTAIAVLITLPFMIVILKPNVVHRVVVLARVIGIITLLAVFAGMFSKHPWFGILFVWYVITLIVFFAYRKRILSRIASFTKRSVLFTKVRTFLAKTSNHGLLDLEHLGQRYYRFIYNTLPSKRARRRIIMAIVAYSVVSFALLPLGLVKNEFFPKVDAETLYVNLELPAGSNKEVTKQAATQVLSTIKSAEGVEYVVLNLGTKMGEMGTSGGGANSALFTLHLPPLDDQKIVSSEIASTLRKELSGFSAGTVSVVEQSGGPPAGADVQIKLSGTDLGELNIYADKIVDYLKSRPTLTNVEKSIKPGTSAVVFEPDYQKLTSMGMGVQEIALWLRTYASGFTMESARLGGANDEQDITFRFHAKDPTLTELSTLVIPTQRGSYPINTFGHFVTKANPTVITREDGKRTISVVAAATKGASISDENKKLLSEAEKIDLPEGYAWATGGVNEENQKSVNSILQAMIVAFILILVTMVVQFQSYRQAVIVLMVIPLAVSSVFIVFALTGTPLSFPALIGVLSLFGIVVTNSMFIVDKINLNIKEGMPFREAVADAGASRLEPIVLTKLCTVLGLLPITLADPLWRGLGGAIISGILVSSTIMLLFIPAVYYSWFAPQDEKRIRTRT